MTNSQTSDRVEVNSVITLSLYTIHTQQLEQGQLKRNPEAVKTYGRKSITLQPASKLSCLGERSESGENVRASGEASRDRGKESLQRSLINVHLYFAQTKGNTTVSSRVPLARLLSRHPPKRRACSQANNVSSRAQQKKTLSQQLPYTAQRLLILMGISHFSLSDPR